MAEYVASLERRTSIRSKGAAALTSLGQCASYELGVFPAIRFGHSAGYLY